MVAVASQSVALAKSPKHHSHMRVAYAPNPFGELFYYALTGRGIDDWMRMERQMRVFNLGGKVLIFILALILKEWLFERVVDSISPRR